MKRFITAELITPELVEIRGLTASMLQAVLDHADPVKYWTKKPAWSRWLSAYKEINPTSFDIRIARVEYDKLVDSESIPDYLYPDIPTATSE